ncbi:MAG: AAA family ATPase [Candidatus Eremiobacteraeota bacterium]|nr:AAA family ATPase [Candidatus Eremiobacteraeota bacterium]
MRRQRRRHRSVRTGRPIGVVSGFRPCSGREDSVGSRGASLVAGQYEADEYRPRANVGSVMFLEAIRRRRGARVDDDFPWTVPALRSLRELCFTAPVTFLMGENGCGKSTLLEALAVAVEARAAGAEEVDADATLAGSRRLAEAFEAVERGRPRNRVFFRAEDAFGFTKRIEREMKEIDAEADAMLRDEKASEFRRRLGSNITRSSRYSLAAKYGDEPHARSHGETFLGIVRAQLHEGGLYLLDEPETPLSPIRMLTLLTILSNAVRRGSQFIIATHSPILAAFPGASILVFNGEKLAETPYGELEHVRVTRDFLNAPQRYLRQLGVTSA